MTWSRKSGGLKFIRCPLEDRFGGYARDNSSSSNILRDDRIRADLGARPNRH
jgi:hypothetical protein